MGLPVDATKPSDVETAVKAVLDKHGRIDGAANCVGSIVLKPAHSTTEEEFAQTLGTINRITNTCISRVLGNMDVDGTVVWQRR